MSQILQLAPFPTPIGGAPSAELELTLATEIGDLDAWLASHGAEVKVLLTHSGIDVTNTLIDRLPRLGLIANFGAGLDRIDLGHVGARGVTVTYTPDLLTNDVADLALALTLAVMRLLPSADAFVRSGAWGQARFPFGASLNGRRVGILGLGRIGEAIAKRAAAFNCDIAYHNRTPKPHAVYAYKTSVLSLAGASDILVAALPGGVGSERIVDGAVLRALGPGGIFINVARGDVVDEEALIQALQTRAIAAAGLDVFREEPAIDPRFLQLDNVVLTPHIGSATQQTRAAMAAHVYENVRRFLRKDALVDVYAAK